MIKYCSLFWIFTSYCYKFIFMGCLIGTYKAKSLFSLKRVHLGRTFVYKIELVYWSKGKIFIDFIKIHFALQIFSRNCIKEVQVVLTYWLLHLMTIQSYNDVSKRLCNQSLRLWLSQHPTVTWSSPACFITGFQQAELIKNVEVKLQAIITWCLL